ncbi:MAG: outer membrane protein assembly factor BamB family protein [Planctomycetota bacterium]|jgi:outer membrane protein assembly factor BamB
MTKIVPTILAIAGLVLLYFWLAGESAMNFQLRLPDPNDSKRIVDSDEPNEIIGRLVTFDGNAADLPGAWPRFRGANLDGISSEDVELARTWPAEGPPVLWSVEAGEGYAGAAILNGRVYILDYDQENRRDVVRCMSLEDGRDIWRYSYPVKLKRWHGMSRTVPTVTQKYVVTMGPKCHVTCLDSETGEFKWMINLVKEFGAAVPEWYTGQCPLIEDDKVILAPGGKALMMAVDCNSGQIIWQTPNPNDWKMTHSSILPIRLNDKRMYVYCASDGVVGISADDGEILWEKTDWKIQIANVPTPVQVSDGLVFFSGGYNAGCMMLELTESNDQINFKEVFRLGPEVFGAEQQTPIYYQGHIYGIRPPPDSQLVCLDTEGKILWTSTRSNRFRLGPYMIANGLIYAMNDSAELTLAEATPSGYVQLDRAKLMKGRESWGPMAIASGRLIVRDLTTILCLDVTER